MKTLIVVCLLAASTVLLVGCTTIPNGGYSGAVKTLGIPGPELGTVQVGEGLLVQTIKIDDQPELNIQINADKVENNPLLFDNVLTIGRFSNVLGSGFSKKTDIYYRKRIDDSGKDSFNVKDRMYLVTWKRDNNDARTHLVSDHYTVTVTQLFPLLGEETPAK